MERPEQRVELARRLVIRRADENRAALIDGLFDEPAREPLALQMQNLS
jgi:hypothetical protein